MAGARGIFATPMVTTSARLIKAWEEHSQQDLKKLAALLDRILDVARKHGGITVIGYYPEEDELVITTDRPQYHLPKDLYSKWDDRDDSDAEINMARHAGAASSVNSDIGVR